MFVLYWRKTVGTKAERRTLVKLTPDVGKIFPEFNRFQFFFLLMNLIFISISTLVATTRQFAKVVLLQGRTRPDSGI
jgi:hypothetical protein